MTASIGRAGEDEAYNGDDGWDQIWAMAATIGKMEAAKTSSSSSRKCKKSNFELIFCKRTSDYMPKWYVARFAGTNLNTQTNMKHKKRKKDRTSSQSYDHNDTQELD